jgi:hypothetical protein
VVEIAMRLKQTVAKAEPLLRQLSEDEVTPALAGGHWSRKQILGHLIDSASNNHQRIVRGQIGDGQARIDYRQDEWVACQRYDAAPWRDLVDLWSAYNRHLAHVIEHTSTGDAYVREVIADYPRHLEHHLAQIVSW